MLYYSTSLGELEEVDKVVKLKKPTSNAFEGAIASDGELSEVKLL